MCFSSSTIDDPTQPAMRTTKLWSHKVQDPTQQPIHITESNEAHMSESQGQDTKGRKGSYKNRAAFVDVTAREPKPVARRPSGAEAEAEAAHPIPKRTQQKAWHGTNPASLGLGFGADFGAGTM